MQLGQLTLETVSGGRFRADGGTTFGVVPRALWAKVFAADDHNMIQQATNCLLIRGGDELILIDTGYGSRLSESQRRRTSSESGEPLLESLESLGVLPEQIGTVVLTHLHYDHVGGALREDDSGRVVPTFPNAAHVVQAGEFERATSGRDELRAAYSADWVTPLADAGVLELIEGDVEIRPGIRGIVTGGHTRHHQAVLIESEGQRALYIADLCPTTRHLKSLWCMGYDEELLVTRRRKSELLNRVIAEGWWVLFDHDPETAGSLLERDARGEFTVAQPLASL
jgi:glyoxylase-like metal-dependent hydrolase (beta-lactamase superfamily II)